MKFCDSGALPSGSRPLPLPPGARGTWDETAAIFTPGIVEASATMRSKVC